MFRFTIRDVLWLTVVVALSLCLYEDRGRLQRMELQVRRTDKALRDLDFRNGRLIETVAKQKLALERPRLETE